jgi:hypothetical protein
LACAFSPVEHAITLKATPRRRLRQNRFANMQNLLLSLLKYFYRKLTIGI